MRVMVMIKADENTEAGNLPDQEAFAAMGAFNEELARSGVLLHAEGLHPSSRGARVHFAKDKTTVVDGPFTEAKELIAGFWLLQVRDLDEALEWIKRSPLLHSDGVDVEIRQVFEAEDFGDAFTPELRDRQNKLWETVSGYRDR